MHYTSSIHITCSFLDGCIITSRVFSYERLANLHLSHLIPLLDLGAAAMLLLEPICLRFSRTLVMLLLLLIYCHENVAMLTPNITSESFFFAFRLSISSKSRCIDEAWGVFPLMRNHVRFLIQKPTNASIYQ